jgi:hypothetical protein
MILAWLIEDAKLLSNRPPLARPRPAAKRRDGVASRPERHTRDTDRARADLSGFARPRDNARIMGL